MQQVQRQGEPFTVATTLQGDQQKAKHFQVLAAVRENRQGSAFDLAPVNVGMGQRTHLHDLVFQIFERGIVSECLAHARIAGQW